MKTKILKISMLAGFLILLMACSKYDEGPGISFRSPEKRVVGLFELSEILIDDVNQLTYYVADSVYLRFTINGEKDNLFIALVEETIGGSQLSSSVFVFNDKKDKVSFGLSTIGIYRDLTDPLFDLIPALNVDNEWTINRLSMDELWLECDYNSQNYYLKFSKLEKYSLL